MTKACRKKPIKPCQFFVNDLRMEHHHQEESNSNNTPRRGLVENRWRKTGPSSKNGTGCPHVGKSTRYGQSTRNKNGWHINKCIDDLLKKSRKKASGRAPAVWIPTWRPTPMSRRSVSPRQPRLHCRKCGAAARLKRVVCSGGFCCIALVLEALRVCNSCSARVPKSQTMPTFHQLQRSQGRRTPPRGGGSDDDESNGNIRMRRLQFLRRRAEEEEPEQI